MTFAFSELILDESTRHFNDLWGMRNGISDRMAHTMSGVTIIDLDSSATKHMIYRDAMRT